MLALYVPDSPDLIKAIVNGNIEAMGTIELGHADDTTIERVSAGVVSIQSNNILTTATGATTGKAIAMAMVFG